MDPGVPATIMEDKVTRQLEEQLAITEGAISVQSRTTESRSSVDLSFPYGTDIDIALRDASTVWIGPNDSYPIVLNRPLFTNVIRPRSRLLNLLSAPAAAHL